MLKLQLSVKIEKTFSRLVDEDLLRKTVELTLAAADINFAVELGLFIAGDDTVHGLNRTYRGVDDTTDVLAFALSESAKDEIEPFVTPPDDVIHLGEVIVSYPQAKKQAEERHHALERELALLVAHGVLHLLGYDHELSEDNRKMRAKESDVLSKIESSRKA